MNTPKKPGVVPIRRQSSLPMNINNNFKNPNNNFNINFNNNFNNNSNNNYKNAVPVNLNAIQVNWREFPADNKTPRTPDRRIKNPFGSLGFLPNQPPPRKHTRKLTRRRKQSRRLRRRS
jgi:hypothetical protein